MKKNRWYNYNMHKNTWIINCYEIQQTTKILPFVRLENDSPKHAVGFSRHFYCLTTLCCSISLIFVQARCFFENACGFSLEQQQTDFWVSWSDLKNGTFIVENILSSHETSTHTKLRKLVKPPKVRGNHAGSFHELFIIAAILYIFQFLEANHS